MAEDFFDLNDVDWDDLENPHPPTEGWHRAEVSDVDSDEGQNVILKFKITAGPSKGKTVRDTLWNPANSEDESKGKVSRNRRMLFAKRLGLITPEMISGGKGARVVWEDAQGTECWIKVEHKQVAGKDKATGQPNGKTNTYANLTFDGVFGINDERVPAEAKAGGGGNNGGNGSNNGGSGRTPSKPTTNAAATAGATSRGTGKANLDDLI